MSNVCVRGWSRNPFGGAAQQSRQKIGAQDPAAGNAQKIKAILLKFKANGF